MVVGESNAITIGDVRFNSSHEPQTKSIGGEEEIWGKLLEHERFASDTLDRKWLARWAAWLVTLWILCVVLILAFCGLNIFCLNPEVVLALLVTSTFNILGLMYIVLRGHFG